MSTFLLTPVGRLVQGSFFEHQTKGYQNVPLAEPEIYTGLAIPKGPEWDQLYAQMYQVAAAGYPNGEFQRTDFAWKFIDCDDPKHMGKFAAYAGHMILKANTKARFNPTVHNNDQTRSVISDPNLAKKGYYYQLQISIKCGTDLANPSIYVNLSMGLLVGYGEEILSGPDAAEVFSQPIALPPGVSATPLATSAPLPLPTPAVGPAAPLPLPTPQPGVAPVPQVAPGGYPQPGVAPAPQVAPQVAPGGYPQPVQPQVAPSGYPQPGVAPAPDYLNGPQ